MITSVGEERANCSAIVNVCGFCSEGFPLSLGAWDRRYFIVALPVPSI